MIKIKSNTGGLDKLSKNMKTLSGEVKLSEWMNQKFISKYSNFNDIANLFEKSGFNIENKEDFEAIPDDQLNEFITNNTSFNSWEEMQKKAMEEYVKEKLFKGL